MNRMIKLFQAKADVAYEKYLNERRKVTAETPKDLTTQPAIGSTAWNISVVEAAKFLTQYDTWSKAAELLRKEELNR